MHDRTGRLEDLRLLTGAGVYTADISLPGQVYAVFVRSPHAHAEIRNIDTSAALSAPGVMAVLTDADIKEAGFGDLPAVMPPPARGISLRPTEYPALARCKVRFVGQPIAMVVATSLNEAQDAAQSVEVNYRELPSVVDSEKAIAKGAPLLFDSVPDNITFVWGMGDVERADAAFARATHVVHARVDNQRLAVCAMEPRAAIALFDAAAAKYTLYAPSQGAGALRNNLANVMKVPPANLRYVTKDVGGGFGMKSAVYPEYLCVLAAARKLGCPIKWVADRSESFISDQSGRDMILKGDLAIDADGRFLALRLRSLVNLGAYMSATGPRTTTEFFAHHLGSCYSIPLLDFEVTCCLGNKPPNGAYRGAGRPEAAYVIERLVEEAAKKLKLDPIELRRRNLISTIEAPHVANNGLAYDSGEFDEVLRQSLRLADDANYEQRRKASTAQGLLRGRGVACYVESAGMPVSKEHVEIRFVGSADNIYAELLTGGGSSGQGHETTFPLVVARAWNVAHEKVKLVQNDSDSVPFGFASVGSRTMSAVATAANDLALNVIEKGKRLAALQFESHVRDIEYDAGLFYVAGTDLRITIWKLAEWAKSALGLPDDLVGGLDAKGDSEVFQTWPNGCHVAEVEIDPETGAVALARYTAVDDGGTIIDTMTAEGQIHGGILTSVGQALSEHAFYDAESGQPLAGTFMDYGIPRAVDLPFLKTAFHVVPQTRQSIGAKGVGEGGATGALPAIMIAINNALAPLGTEYIDGPATPAKIWKAISKSQTRSVEGR